MITIAITSFSLDLDSTFTLDVHCPVRHIVTALVHILFLSQFFTDEDRMVYIRHEFNDTVYISLALKIATAQRSQFGIDCNNDLNRNMFYF